MIYSEPTFDAQPLKTILIYIWGCDANQSLHLQLNLFWPAVTLVYNILMITL